MIATLAAALLLQAADAAPVADPIGDLIAAQSPEAGEAEIQVATAEADAERAMLMAASASSFCEGVLREGGLLICDFVPGARVQFGDMEATADDDGYTVLGIPRDAPETLTLRIDYDRADGGSGEIVEMLSIEQREYALQHVNGVPQATVTPDESTLPRRQREYAQKRAALSTRWEGQGFLDGFIRPSEGITTGVYGSARVYNDGHQGNPHWGLDWANETGTPVVAPAGGRIILAEGDMYYEGGLVFLDHGQGLVSLFLHMSAVHVSEGDMVEQGDLIGEIGAGGRATGPHLDWRVKINDDFYVDPAMILQLDLSPLQD